MNQQLSLFSSGVSRDENGVAHLVALSGGADSSALAVLLRERRPDVHFTFFSTPTGDELPEMREHMGRLEAMLGQPIVRISGTTLDELIETFGSLPNHRQRWCTRMLKVRPAQDFMAASAPAIQYVGLRADEPERTGILGSGFPQRFPLREWGMSRADVLSALEERGICIPRRTDCARCYEQRIIEWKMLLEENPDVYEHACRQEDKTGHTFRSPSRDTWPASLRELAKEFKSGRKVRGEDIYRERAVCRACSL